MSEANNREFFLGGDYFEGTKMMLLSGHRTMIFDLVTPVQGFISRPIVFVLCVSGHLCTDGDRKIRWDFLTENLVEYQRLALDGAVRAETLHIGDPITYNGQDMGSLIAIIGK